MFTYAGADTETRKALLKLYVQHWMEKSPVEVLLALRRKGEGGAFATFIQRATDRGFSGGDSS